VIEYIAEHDDTLLEKFVGGQSFTVAELRASIRRSTIALKLIPVVAGSAFKNKGIQPMLDAVVDYLPSPIDVPPWKARQLMVMSRFCAVLLTISIRSACF